MVLQNPIRLFPRHLDRVTVAASFSELGSQVGELQLANVVAGVPLAEEMSSRPHRLDHVQRELLLAGIQALKIPADVVVNVRMQDQCLGIEHRTTL